MRIAHFADTHLGYRALKRQTPEGENARGVDVRLAFIATIDAIIEAKPDLIVHAGDLFDRPRPGWSDLSLAIQGFRALQDIPTFVIAGNHDTATLRSRDNVFTVLRNAVPHLTVASGDEQVYEYFQIGAGPVAINLIASRKLRSDQPPTALLDPDAINLMVLHGIASDIPGFRHAPLPGEEQVPDALLARGYDYIAMGDWHGFQQVRPNAWYCGATERFGWGEVANQPGWALVEIERGQPPIVTHQPITTRPMIDLPEIRVNARDVDETLAVLMGTLTIPSPPPDAMVRQHLSGIPNQPYAAQLQRVMSKVAANYPVWSYGMAWTLLGRELTGDDLDLPSFTATLPHLDVREMFREYVAAQSYHDDPFGKRFLAQGADALEVAVQRQAERSMVDE